jgi:hypothetical protein
VRRLWIRLLPLITLVSACQLTIQEETPGVRKDRPLVEADRPVPYERFLVLMDGDQRQAFFELRTTKNRERFLLETGLTIRRMLADNLRLGMTTSHVGKILGRPVKEHREEYSTVPSERYLRVVDEWWVYQRQDTGNLVFIPFRKGWVVDWLLEPEIRQLVHIRPTDRAGLVRKEKSLIHVQEKMPNLLRNPGEEKANYLARMRRVAPILFSKGPPKWPEALPMRAKSSDFMKQKVSKQEVYSWWGDTSKLYESPPEHKPRYHYESHTRWTYKIFNGYGYIYYSLYFQDNRLIDWVVETDIGK